ncbi:Mitogen-activated protein kinase kinase 2 [Zostera marina]|uniref:mitogen-activated protein kinase kinase n=1 Tax=Zostera marina TaxID=29655 RepID=A0A0K9PKS5_ZOSMR|nr:Mitogen-activated protein kinase kinase 2 [Zostera marina]
MKRKEISKPRKLQISVPSNEVPFEEFLTASGILMTGDLLVNKDGVRVVSQNNEKQTSLINAPDNQLLLSDIEAIKVIGKGSGGTVQLVKHKWTGQFFALKVIQMRIEDRERKQIARELKINQSSQCPYAVVCYQIFYDNGVISIVMEYMDGGSLADFLRKVKSIPEQYLAAICKQVLKGLVYLHHEKHIIHRDLKPSNILINHGGDVKITDFGVSVVGTSTYGHQGTFIGTKSYMSPERINGSIYGSKSDIWSLGLVCLQLAQGQFPYPPFDSFFELLDTVVNEPAPQASPEMFSPEFCSFISACLQKNPSDRSSAQVLLEHPFLGKYDDLSINLASYFSSLGRPLATF